MAADLPRILLAAAALVIHLGLLLLAPVAADIADATGRLLAGRAPAPLGDRWHSILGAARSATPALLGEFGCVFAAAVLVPSFATGMLTAPLDDLVLVALLLAGGRLAAMFAAGEAVRGLPALPLSVPALLLAALALALIAGTTGIDSAIGAAPSAAPVPLALVALALGLAGLADTDAGGAGSALSMLSAALRLLVWLDLVAALLPPWSTTASTAGPRAWLAALLLWPLKVAALAVVAGAVRFGLSTARASWRLAALRAASLLALLGGVFVLVGQVFE